MLSSCFKVHKLIVNSPIVTFMRVVVIDVLCHIASLFKIIIPSRYLLLSLLLPLSFPYFSCLLLLFRTYLHLSKLDFYNNCQEKSFRISTLYVHKNLNSIGKKSFYFFRIEISISKYMIFHHERNGEDLIEEKISRIVLFQKRRTC